MKTALLHYWLTNRRGGEQVLSALGRLLPDADIYTHAFGHKIRTPGEDGVWEGHRVWETFIARLPLGRRKPQAYLPLMPVATRRIALDGYDLIVSSESGPIKGIRKPKGARHICYCHTPMRYLWDLHDEYYRDAGPLGKLAMRLFTPYLRREDLKSAECVDTFVANSAFVADRIKRIYGRDSTVVYPPVDVDFFGDCERTPGDYYLFAGAPVKYKRLDLARAACARLGRRLVVAGGGEFTREDMRAAYAGARALLFPGERPSSPTALAGRAKRSYQARRDFSSRSRRLIRSVPPWKSSRAAHGLPNAAVLRPHVSPRQFSAGA